jgi:hypothetical protein
MRTEMDTRYRQLYHQKAQTLPKATIGEEFQRREDQRVGQRGRKFGLCSALSVWACGYSYYRSGGRGSSASLPWADWLFASPSAGTLVDEVCLRAGLGEYTAHLGIFFTRF